VSKKKKKKKKLVSVALLPCWLCLYLLLSLLAHPTVNLPPFSLGTNIIKDIGTLCLDSNTNPCSPPEWYGLAIDEP